ncbi:MAG: hypothetical protein KC431_05020, partial [Myxococcales bacterium]|nr:hypothetical protein [Myxococcales bacterium]
TTAVELLADFGTDRDLTGLVQASAPFERLGLDPIGPATQAPSALAKAMPPDAIGVWLMPWGDPGMLHQILDKRIPVNEIPAPFDGYAGDVIKGLHGVLGAVDKEVLMAPYLDDKGNMTLVFAASVKDEDGARAAVRQIFTAADKAFTDHIALTGTSPDHTYKVSFKKDGVKAGKFKGDLFTLTVPKDKQKDLEDAAWFVGKKPQLEVAVVVADGKLVMAMGVGQKSFMSALGKRLGKAGDGGLEAGGGLALARKLSNGCQYCVAIDPIEAAEFAFMVVANNQDDPEEVRKAAKAALAKVGKLGIDGEVALAARFGTGQGAFGFGMPKGLLFTDSDKVKALVELFKSIDEAREKAAGATAKAVSP